MIDWTGEPSRPRGDVDPVVARAAAAAVLGDVDLAGRGADVDEVAQVADALGSVGVGGTVGQGDAEVAGAAEDRRVADVEPGHAVVRGGEDLPVDELMTTSLPLTGLTAKLATPANGHCGSGVGRPLDRLEQAEGPAGAVDLEEVGVGAAGAGEPVLIDCRSCAPNPAGRWPRRCCSGSGWCRRERRST